MKVKSSKNVESLVQFKSIEDVATALVFDSLNSYINRKYYKYCRTILRHFKSLSDYDKIRTLEQFKCWTEHLASCIQNHDYDWFEVEFIPQQIEPIHNKNQKPQGGLWASPVLSLDTHTEKCNRFIFRLKPNAHIFILDSKVDLELLLEFYPHYYSYLQQFVMACGFPTPEYYLNFEEIAKEYDAILVTNNAIQTLSHSEYGDSLNLYGWESETLLVLNPYMIEKR